MKYKPSTNPKKNPSARRKRNPLPHYAPLQPKPTSKLAQIMNMRKSAIPKGELCKECKTRKREYASSRCAECSENHV